MRTFALGIPITALPTERKDLDCRGCGAEGVAGDRDEVLALTAALVSERDYTENIGVLLECCVGFTGSSRR